MTLNHPNLSRRCAHWTRVICLQHLYSWTAERTNSLPFRCDTRGGYKRLHLYLQVSLCEEHSTGKLTEEAGPGRGCSMFMSRRRSWMHKSLKYTHTPVYRYPLCSHDFTAVRCHIPTAIPPSFFFCIYPLVYGITPSASPYTYFTQGQITTLYSLSIHISVCSICIWYRALLLSVWLCGHCMHALLN